MKKNKNAQPPETEANKSRRLLQLGLGVVVLVILLQFIDFRTVFRSLQNVHVGLTITVFAIAFVARATRAIKWNYLLRTQGIQISHWHAIRYSLVGHFFGAWTPGALGSDAYRITALRGFKKPEAVLSTLILERYAGFLVVSLFAMATMPFTLRYLIEYSPWLAILVLAVAGISVCLLPCLLSERIGDKLASWLPQTRKWNIGPRIQKLYDTLARFRQHPTALAVFGALTVAEIFGYFLINYVSARALNLDVSFAFFLCAMPVVHLLIRIPITFQALGIQEGFFSYALILAGLTAADGIAVSLLQRAVEWICTYVPGALLLVFTQGVSPEASDSAEIDLPHPSTPETDLESREEEAAYAAETF